MNDDEAFRLRFGKRIRFLRATRDITQEVLGDDCGLDQSYISGIERGKRNVSLNSIRLLALALGVTLSELFEGMDEDRTSTAD
jgi:transcriptional regulator with XRE-family HTH domain